MTRAMKDSGVEWIGEIPQEWKTLRTKYLFAVVNGATPKSGVMEYWEGQIPWITPADYTNDKMYIEEIKRYITEEGLDSCGTTLVPKDSIIVSNRAPIGLVALAPFELCTNQGCKALVKKCDLIEEYYYYYFSVMNSPLNMLGRGTTFLELSSSDLNDFSVPVPKKETQKSIAVYLNKKCAEIDSVINSKQEQNKLLHEQRQSIIYEAVTKGLDKNAPMKDSGVEWIGEIPQNWNLKRFKYALSDHCGGAWGDEPQNNENDIVCLRVADFDYSNFDIDLSDLTIRNYRDDIIAKLLLRKGDILLEKSGGGEITPVGRSVIYNDDSLKCLFANFIERLTPGKDQYPQFVNFWLSAAYSNGNSKRNIKQTTGIQNLDVSAFLSEYYPIVEYYEQKHIADFLIEKCAELDRLIQANIITINELKDYRQSVIFEAVTGKKEIS